MFLRPFDDFNRIKRKQRDSEVSIRVVCSHFSRVIII